MAASPTVTPAVIPAGQALTPYIPLVPKTLVGILVPNGWTAANLSLQASVDGGATMFEFGNAAGLFAITVPGTTGEYIGLDPNIFRGVTGIIIRSGTAASPVNQVSQATLQVITTPLL
jgi:hypothetical protein